MRFSFRAMAMVATVIAAASSLGAEDEAAAATLDNEAEVVAEPVPPAVENSAVEAVSRLGNEVVLGRYHAALEQMNPLWKERTAARMGGMEALERQLEGVAAEMVRQGITMMSFRPQGRPLIHQVSPGRRKVREGGVEVERLTYSRWLVLVPTVTRFRITHQVPGEAPKSRIIESTGFQVAISDKDKLDWTFIDGAGLKPADLRSLFSTLPQDMELPPVGKREVR